MASDVFLHIGAPKTGTSFLQLTVWDNREQVEAAGVRLLLGRRGLQFDAVAEMRGGMWSHDGLKATWADLAAEAREAPDRALVTEELLCATPAEKIGPLVESLQPARVHVVLTARDIGRQVPAEWQQAVRGRSAAPYGPWLDMLRDDPSRPFWDAQDPARVLARWLPHVPAERIHLVTVPPPGAPSEELWRRFSSVVGLPESGLGGELTHRNPSLGVHEAEVLRRLNARLGSRLPMRQPYTDIVRDHLMRPVLFRESPRLKLGVPPEHADWLGERSREIAAAVRELGVHVVGDPDDLVSERMPEGADPAQLPVEEILDASVDTLIGVLLHLEEDLLPALKKARAARRRLRSQLAAPSSVGTRAWARFGRLRPRPGQDGLG